MVNTENFIKRLEIIMDYYTINASAFADKIGVQRSSLSHLLSGRNKPSLDFILKIEAVFPDLDLYWILYGKGKFPANSFQDEIEIVTEKINLDSPLTSSSENGDNLFKIAEIPLIENISENTKTYSNENITTSTTSNEIDKIVIFYKNGTFKDYKPLN